MNYFHCLELEKQAEPLQEYASIPGTNVRVRLPTPLQDARAKLEAMESHAKRLALSLECLLLSCKDIAAVSKWWDSSHVALTEYQAAIDLLYPPKLEQAEPVAVQPEPVAADCTPNHFCGYRWIHKPIGEICNRCGHAGSNNPSF